MSGLLWFSRVPERSSLPARCMAKTLFASMQQCRLTWYTSSCALRAGPARCARPGGRARAGRPAGVHGHHRPAPQLTPTIDRVAGICGQADSGRRSPRLPSSGECPTMTAHILFPPLQNGLDYGTT
jgi:hypothetical protein